MGESFSRLATVPKTKASPSPTTSTATRGEAWGIDGSSGRTRRFSTEVRRQAKLATRSPRCTLAPAPAKRARMSITIRPAEEKAAAFVGWASFLAARGHLPRGWFDIVLQRPEAVCLEFCARLAGAKARSWWHWSLFTIAEAAQRGHRRRVRLPGLERGHGGSGQCHGHRRSGAAAILAARHLHSLLHHQRARRLDGGERGDAAGAARRRAGAGAIGERIRAGPRRRLPPRPDQLSDRQRAGRARLPEGGIQIRRREASAGIRSRDGRSGSQAPRPRSLKTVLTDGA